MELTSQLGEVALGLAQIAQDALALDGGERPRDRAKIRRGALCQASDACEVTGQGFGRAYRRRRFALRVEAFEKKHRIGEQPRPGLSTSRAPGSAQSADLAAGESMLGRGTGQLKARLPVTAHQRNQILHGRGRRDLAGAQEILDLGRQLVDQRQPARDPARVAAQTPCQLSRREAEATQL